jgi:hypothetical protein
MSREQVIEFAYNELLRVSNMGPLRGFGLCNNFKDTLYGNPETKRISVDNNLTYTNKKRKEELIMKASITKTELKKVAKELNEELGLEPPILLNLKVEALKKKCIQATTLIDVEQDEFTEGAWETLKKLECDIPGVAEATGEAPEEEVDEEADSAVEESDEETEDKNTEEVEEPQETGDEKVAEGDVEDVEIEDEDVEIEDEDVEIEDEETQKKINEALNDTLVENFKAAKKLAELKEMLGEWECFEKLDQNSYTGLSGYRKLRADMLTCMPEELQQQFQSSSNEGSTEGTSPKPKRKRASAEEIQERNSFIEGLIVVGKYTKKEILEKVLEKFEGINKSTIQTLLSDSKNPKYNKLVKLTVEDENKIMSFQQEG